jgi:hypothetical protein
MKETLIFLWLVTQPPCADAIFTNKAGPFEDTQTCEEYMAHTVKHQGPPTPGSRYVCREKGAV